MENGKWVPKTPNPLWAQLEKECKSGDELYQRAKEAGLLHSNFPKMDFMDSAFTKK
jgi:hypothetical protein